MPKYLIKLTEYGGDATYVVVGKKSFDWIESPRPVDLLYKSSVVEAVPPDVLSEATDDSVEEPYVMVTSGSCENDRAIHLMIINEKYFSRPRGKFAATWEGVLY